MVVLVVFLLFVFLILLMNKVRRNRIKKKFLYKSQTSEEKLVLQSEHQTRLLTDIEFYLKIFFYFTIISIMISIILSIYFFTGTSEVHPF